MKSMAAALAVIVAISGASPSFALSKGYCRAYARDVANHRANVGNVLLGTAVGAGLGALGGAIVGGHHAVGTGALIGGGAGTVVGGVRTNDKWHRVYDRAYADCRASH
jgi:hypothetical protein